jgi:hypothetical protein
MLKIREGNVDEKGEFINFNNIPLAIWIRVLDDIALSITNNSSKAQLLRLAMINTTTRKVKLLTTRNQLESKLAVKIATGHESLLAEWSTNPGSSLSALDIAASELYKSTSTPDLELYLGFCGNTSTCHDLILGTLFLPSPIACTQQHPESTISKANSPPISVTLFSNAKHSSLLSHFNFSNEAKAARQTWTDFEASVNAIIMEKHRRYKARKSLPFLSENETLEAHTLHHLLNLTDGLIDHISPSDVLLLANLTTLHTVNRTTSLSNSPLDQEHKIHSLFKLWL